ncbi:ice-binding family protein [Polymorphospora rubra]|uniref:ice-binding family protein n=1 Tax=Polymorphospora rubra TaxID=338584 RepID=UPI0033F192DC
MTVNAALRAPARRGLRGLALALSGALASGVVLAPPPAYAANGPVSLGAADRYAVLAGETVNNVGNSVIGGDVGVSPGETLAGFPPGVVNGERHPADESAAHAQRDLTSAYDDASNRVSTDPTGTELGGKTLAPGVYTSTDAVALTGTLTLDARGDANAVFVFQLATTLVTGANSRVQVVNSPRPLCNVYWKVGTSATLGSDTEFVGVVMALDSVSLNARARVTPGAVLARNGAVSLDENTVNRASCIPAAASPGATGRPVPSPSPTPSPSASPSPSPSSPTPTPSSPSPSPSSATPSPSSPSPTTPSPTTPSPTTPSPTTPSPTTPSPTTSEPSAPGSAPTQAPAQPPVTAPAEPVPPAEPPAPAPVQPEQPAPVQPELPPAQPEQPVLPEQPVAPEQPAVPAVPNLEVPQGQ